MTPSEPFPIPQFCMISPPVPAPAGVEGAFPPPNTHTHVCTHTLTIPDVPFLALLVARRELRACLAL